MFFSSHQERNAYFLFPTRFQRNKQKNIGIYSKEIELDLFKEDGWLCG
jgi:hypothetical protein